MNGLASILLAYLLNSLWQAPLVAGAAWLAARAARRLGPGAEHRIWVGALALETLLPALALLHWERLTLPAGWGAGAAEADGGSVAVSAGGALRIGFGHAPEALLAALALGYAAVVVCFAARLGKQWFRLAALRRCARPIHPAGTLAVAWSRSVGQFGVDDARLALSSQVFGPVTAGWRRPTVILPEEMAERLGAAEMATVIAHEFAHMQRHDFAKNLLYEALSLPLRYHPACWLARERVTETREQVCDAMAASLDGPHSYARSLLKLAELLTAEPMQRTPQAIGIFDTQTFERRIMKLAEKQAEWTGMRRLAVLAVCAALGTGACASALALGLRAAPMAAAASAAEKPKSVPAGEMTQHLLSKVAPVYPADAKKAHIQGTVVLSAVIDKEGNVRDLRVISGPEELQQSSLEAVKQWKYKPYTLDGELVEVETTINIIYTLGK